MLAQRLSPLPIRAVYTSPLERALETAQPIAAEHGIQPQNVEDLGEMRFGAWEGLSFQDLESQDDWHRYNTYRSAVRPPGGELMMEVQTRMIRRLECMRSRHTDEMVAVVSHGDPLRSVICHLLGIPLDFLMRFEISPASVSVVEAADWGCRVLCLNATGDLSI
jgi:broad specificity phosphatase PhoE